MFKIEDLEFVDLDGAMAHAKSTNEFVTITGPDFEVCGMFGVDSVVDGKCPDGVEYDWKDGNGHSYGLLAQEVEKVLPGAVKTNDSGYKSVNYIMLIPFLIETIKQLGSEVADLKKSRSRGKK